MKVEIMSWNTALTEKFEHCENITKYIKEFLNKENSVAVLQQIPFKKKINDKWEIDLKYETIKKEFPKEQYCIFCNEEYNKGYIVMMTILITKMKNFEKADKIFYPNQKITNRECAVEMKNESKEKFIILGIHASNGHENNKYLMSINGSADIILGDFNAGNYSESENIQTFNNILKDHVCICNMPTKEIFDQYGRLKRKTCIDHIFVKRKLIPNCSNMVVHENIKYSDHYPISFEIEI